MFASATRFLRRSCAGTVTPHRAFLRELPDVKAAAPESPHVCEFPPTASMPAALRLRFQRISRGGRIMSGGYHRAQALLLAEAGRQPARGRRAGPMPRCISVALPGRGAVAFRTDGWWRGGQHGATGPSARRHARRQRRWRQSSSVRGAVPSAGRRSGRSLGGCPL